MIVAPAYFRQNFEIHIYLAWILDISVTWLEKYHASVNIVSEYFLFS